MEAQSEPLAHIGCWVALAERLAAEGQMNLNKLVEAAIYARLRRIGWLYQPEMTADRLSAEFETCLPSLRLACQDQEWQAALEAGKHLLAGDRIGDLAYKEAPDVFVCRNCGYLEMTETPAHCPQCGAWPGGYRKFVAIFNSDNSEPRNPQTVMECLSNNADELVNMVGSLNETQLRRSPASGGWSLREHITHFYDTQQMLDRRVGLMLEHNNPELQGLAVYALAREEAQHPSDTLEMLALYCTLRQATVTKLNSLPLKDLWRTGMHSEFGKITILRQVIYVAQHEQTHLPDVEKLCLEVSV
jgi:hypothetical protein